MLIAKHKCIFIVYDKLTVLCYRFSVNQQKRTPRKKEIERKQQLNIENWLKNKFREGFFSMREAFENKDPDKSGVVSDFW